MSRFNRPHQTNNHDTSALDALRPNIGYKGGGWSETMWSLFLPFWWGSKRYHTSKNFWTHKGWIGGK